MICIGYVDKRGSRNVQRQTKKLCYIAKWVHFTDKVCLENAAATSISFQMGSRGGGQW